MSLNNTPRAGRLHIGIFGRRNAGKSSLINALTGQDLAIVSDTPGTTADPVYKSMELHPIGPVVFIDTAGFDDEGELGELRTAKTASVIDRTDVAILVIDGSKLLNNDGAEFPAADGSVLPGYAACSALPDAPHAKAPDSRDIAWLARLEDAGIPIITVLNKLDAAGQTDLSGADLSGNDAFASAIPVSAKTGEGIEALRTAIVNAVPEEYMEEDLLGDLLEDGSLVLLVMPQDIQAPKGRLILPQVQTLRALLDRKCQVMSTTADGLSQALQSLNRAPDLIITDSQCFDLVYQNKPEQSALTSFSILMAAAKGDIDVFTDGVKAIDTALQNSDAESSSTEPVDPFRVLIAEACTHVPQNEDIGTVKIPRLLQKQFGDRVVITNVRGNDFPAVESLRQYDLIIHCGACMFNRRHVLSRIASAREAGVPITNYGIFLAKMAGILDKVSL